ncbi:MAG: GtrA family protein [Tenericutes bacterium]|nr:GtrA family protein [Mycoplasmatota bacterium]
MKELINQIAKFGVVGIIATLIDYILLFILTDVFKIYYMTSSIISFSASLIFNYIASIKWVFNVEHKQTYKDGLLFLIFSLIGLWINQEVMYLTVEKLGIYYMISKIFATGIVMVWNFITRKIFIENYEKVVAFLKKS